MRERRSTINWPTPIDRSTASPRNINTFFSAAELKSAKRKIVTLGAFWSTAQFSFVSLFFRRRDYWMHGKGLRCRQWIMSKWWRTAAAAATIKRTKFPNPLKKIVEFELGATVTFLFCANFSRDITTGAVAFETWTQVSLTMRVDRRRKISIPFAFIITDSLSNDCYL